MRSATALPRVAGIRLDRHADLDVAGELDPRAEQLTAAVRSVAAKRPLSEATLGLGLLMWEGGDRCRGGPSGQDFEGAAPRALCTHRLCEGIKSVRGHATSSSSAQRWRGD